MGPFLEELPLLGARPKGEILVIAGLVAGTSVMVSRSFSQASYSSEVMASSATP